MRKILSLCLFGDNPLYSEGAIENILLASCIYPGWEVIVYVDVNLDPYILERLAKCSCTIVPCHHECHSEGEKLVEGMYWRLYALDLPGVSHIIFRDCDSRISSKEAASVGAWILSGKDCHFMYDHEWHSVPILGGMWGCRGGLFGNIKEQITKFNSKLPPEATYWERCDQSFLKECIWNRCSGDISYLAHGNQEKCHYHITAGIDVQPFPAYVPIVDGGQIVPSFIGQAITVNGARPKTPKKIDISNKPLS